MQSIKVILTGATGMVGEGVLLECLQHPAVAQVLMVNRRTYPLTHPKLKELLVADFMDLAQVQEQLKGYDACFFCAGISVRGLNEAQYTHITYDITLNFARTLLALNPGMVFNYVSGAHTDSAEKSRMMWARVKGRTENALLQLPFKKVYNFRPGLMQPVKGQRNIVGYYKIISALFPVLQALFPNQALTLHTVGRAMVNSVLKGYSKPVLEVQDIRALAEAEPAV